ncbi:hypothetical protein [Marilutibacter chinensis]|uniref:Uncharacterized protein n=1 Tax=Marilutibacter chinensis TaxID=2912247 RepID=A0ABS9HUR5_9GAMM|nr:hypothetical protein [Lysobacter chinensis]MCF7222610.1 hypothetical protein [Lysobacter chinensis]
MSAACHHCGCDDACGAKQHAILDALIANDIDRAIDLDLMTVEPCPRCKPSCHLPLIEARTARKRALEARERYRGRLARLQRLADEQKARRAPAPSPAFPDDAAGAPERPRSALPDAAAAALARAKARAAGRER